MDWCEYGLWYGGGVNPEKLYHLRKLLFPILDEHKIENFLILNEPERVIFRIKINDETKDIIQKNLQKIIKQSEDAFSRITIEKWNPEEDARKRIMDAAQKLGLKLKDGQGWMISGLEPLKKHWILNEDNLDLKIKEFSTFMTKVVGKFTKAYVQEMPRLVQDRWLLSVLIHLLLNSISVDQIQENESRAFLYV